jgi:CTP synthase (UTP-ammonia lyase)
MPTRIGLIGDYTPTAVAHQAIPLALAAAGADVQVRWIPTVEITGDSTFDGFDGLWCVPASPYRNTEGALHGIRFAREHGIPFLGTCGGFQHAILEYARNVWGLSHAAHAELEPDAANPVIVPLECSLVEARGHIRFVPATRLAELYGALESNEGYHCRYGVSPSIVDRLASGPLRANAHDDTGDVRGIELTGHPFFIATLFQVERRALTNAPNPLVDGFVAAATKFGVRPQT